MAHHTGFFGLLLILTASKAAYYVQTGTDKQFCGFKCYQPNGILQLRCNNINQLLAECSNSVLKIYHLVNQRISLNNFTGCLKLKDAQKNDTGSYQFLFHNAFDTLVLKSIKITVLDAVKIQDITSNRSLQGSDVSLTVLFSGSSATVFWKLDGGSLPMRYSLKDNNRTLLIENVTKEDAKSVLAVWVINPVSEDMLEYSLENKDERNRVNRKVTRVHLSSQLQVTHCKNERKQFSSIHVGIMVSCFFLLLLLFLVILKLMKTLCFWNSQEVRKSRLKNCGCARVLIYMDMPESRSTATSVQLLSNYT